MRRIKETRVEVEARMRHAEEQTTVLRLALNDALEGKLEYVKSTSFRDRVDDRPQTIVARVSRLDAPHGGLLVLSYSAPDQKPYHAAYYLEHWLFDRMKTRGGSMSPEAIAYNKVEDALRVRKAKVSS